MQKFGDLLSEERKVASLRLCGVIIGIALANQLALKFYWYSAIWWFDMPMHFAGGVFGGLLGLWLAGYFFSAQFADLSFIRGLAFLMLFVFVAGGAWEVFEFVVDANITQNGFNVLDTLSDLCFDLAGGVTALLFSVQKTYR